MSSTMTNRSPALLIAGCGYLGRALARRALEHGASVLGLCHSRESALALEAEGIPARPADLSSASAVEAVAAVVPENVCVVHSAAGGRGGGVDAYRAVYLEGMRNLVRAFPLAQRMIFTSSTSVYAQTDGAWVTEDTTAEPDRGTGRLLREAENSALAAGGAVVRLAGIYGPGRSVLLRNFLRGESVIDVREEPPATPDGRWINQIHRDDAAAALWHLLTAVPDDSFRHTIYNVADSTPLLQRPLYRELARRFGRPLPPEAAPDHTRKRGWTHKRVDAARLRAAGWAPRYASWFDALERDAALVPSIMSQLENC
jgi:nucleoside-diphosphate-sugar epimerase